MHEIPDRGESHSKMRIVAQDGAAGGRTVRRDCPAIAPVAGWMPITCGNNIGSKLPRTTSAVPNCTSGHGRVVGVCREERAKLVRLVGELGSNGDEVKTRIKGGGKEKGEAFTDGQSILRPP